VWYFGRYPGHRASAEKAIKDIAITQPLLWFRKQMPIYTLAVK
jgi:hypothetical protein